MKEINPMEVKAGEVVATLKPEELKVMGRANRNISAIDFIHQ